MLYDNLNPGNYSQYGAQGLPPEPPAPHWQPRLPAYRQPPASNMAAPMATQRQPTYAQYYGGRMPQRKPAAPTPRYGMFENGGMTNYAAPPQQQMQQMGQMQQQQMQGRYRNPLANHPMFRFGLPMIGSGSMMPNGLTPDMMEQMLGMGYNYRPTYTQSQF